MKRSKNRNRPFLKFILSINKIQYCSRQLRTFSEKSFVIFNKERKIVLRKKCKKKEGKQPAVEKNCIISSENLFFALWMLLAPEISNPGFVILDLAFLQIRCFFFADTVSRCFFSLRKSKMKKNDVITRMLLKVRKSSLKTHLWSLTVQNCRSSWS